jgi:type II secretory pathway pseudopilin PulG
MFKNKQSGFSLIEILVAAGLTVIISIALFAGVNSLTSGRKDALTRERLAILTYDTIEDIERKLEQKFTSPGNLFIKDISYPFAYKKNYPNEEDSMLVFCINIENQPCLVAYICTKIPDSISTNRDSENVRGLFFIQKTPNETESILNSFTKNSNIFENFSKNDCTIATLLAEDVVNINLKLAEIPLKYESKITFENEQEEENYQSKCEEQILRYIDIENHNDILIYSGKIISNSIEISSYNLQLLDIEIQSLDKNLHEIYFTLTSNEERKNYMRKHGFRMSRLIPWFI